MRKKLLCTVAAVAMMTGLFVVGATPALAEDPPASFLPDDDGAGTADGDVLSDRFDGVDSAAHLTAVTQTGIDRAEWYHCPEASGDDDDITQAELSACTQMGVDNDPNQPVPGSTFVPADLAWDITFGVPQDLDNQTLAVVVLGCVGAGTDVEAPGANCQESVEDDINFDDAATGEPDTTTAEIFQICTADTPFGPDGTPGSGDTCDVGGTTQGTDDREEIDALFKDFEHGDPVPNEGFVMRVRTSPDLVASDLVAHIDEGADANLDPTTADETGACAVIETFSTFKTWECEFTDAELDDDVEFALWVQDTTGGTGTADTCDGDLNICVLDSHYNVAVERAAVEAIKSFDPEEGGSPDPPDISPNAGCEADETRDDEHSTNDLGDDIDEEGCLNDQFGDPFDGDYTVESTGVGGILFCEGTLHDHDGDGVNEHCHDDTDSDGVDDWELWNPNAEVGDQNILFCFDEENGGTSTTPPTDHGCDDETVTDENVMHWATEATQVFLAYAGTGTDPNDPCRTGQTFKNNRVGDTEDLIACTFDSNGNPVNTQPNGASGGRLRWSIETTVGGELTGVRFTSTPPSETSGSEGQATTRIQAFRESSNFVIVELLDENGDFQDSFQIEKRIEPRRNPRACDIIGTNRADRLSGTGRGERICARGGNDRVRARGGNDNVLGQGGRDRLFGQGGRDRMTGGSGRDRLAGGPGRDRLIGGPGRDVCIGGPGRDTFRSCEVRRQ